MDRSGNAQPLEASERPIGLSAHRQAAYSRTVATDEQAQAGHARAAGKSAHALQFYSDDAQLAARVAEFLIPAFDAGDGVLVIASPEHRSHLREVLTARGIAIGAAEAAGRFLALDARQTLRKFLRDGALDAGLFEKVVGTAIDRATAAGRPARVYTEMVSLLWRRADPTNALALERIWNEMHERRGFTQLCGYPARIFSEPNDGVLARIANAHGRVAPVEGVGFRL